MIVQASKATQAEFVRDFVACSDKFSDESDSSQSEDDNDDEDYYRQSRKSLPGHGNIKGIAQPSADTLHYHTVAGKSLPSLNGYSARSPGELLHYHTMSGKSLPGLNGFPAMSPGETQPPQWSISSGKKLPSSSIQGRHDFETALHAREEELPLDSLPRKPLDESGADSEATISSSDSQERGPRKIRHAPMTAEDQERTSALLRAKLAQFEVNAPKQKNARGKKRKSVADVAPTTIQGTKLQQNVKKRRSCGDDRTLLPAPPAQKADVDMFLFGPLPRPIVPDPGKRYNKKDKMRFLHPDLQTLMAKLDRLGGPWNNALREVLHQSSRRLVSAAHDASTDAEVTASVQHWKTSHHQQLTQLVDMLVHYAVVPIGGVQVPADSAFSLAPKQPPPRVSDLEKMLAQFGTPFEQALWNIVEHVAMRVVDEKGEVAAVERSVDIANQWTLSNRQRFRDLTSILERLGVVTVGKVIVPYGDRLILPCVQLGQHKDSAFVQTETEMIKLEGGQDKS